MRACKTVFAKQAVFYSVRIEMPARGITLVPAGTVFVDVKAVEAGGCSRNLGGDLEPAFFLLKDDGP